MHPNPIYRGTARNEALQFALGRGFGTLMINAPEGPLAAHVPFVLSADGDSAELHLVRSNPILRMLGVGTPREPQPALMAVTGPDAYVSPDWYGIADQVPTWNYLAVHLHGRLEALPAEDLRGHLDRLSAAFENRLLPKQPWRVDKVAPEVLARLMRMILPCRLAITDIQSTWKLGQNKSAEARAGAAAGLEAARIGQETGALAALMRAFQAGETD